MSILGRLQNKPEYQKRVIALSGTIFVTGIIFIVWIAFIANGIAGIDETTTAGEDSFYSQLSQLTNLSGEAFSRIGEGVSVVQEKVGSLIDYGNE